MFTDIIARGYSFVSYFCIRTRHAANHLGSHIDITDVNIRPIAVDDNCSTPTKVINTCSLLYGNNGVSKQ